ncbi:MAG: hypothetical protein CL607_14035 [Anaerolineaceae bacterium]|nr:hypothetical protein [Anaerolineaceae bacterium]
MFANNMSESMAKHWWLLVVRGVFAVLFGGLTILMPEITLYVLVLMFGVYVIVDGGFSIYAALTGRQKNQRWWLGLLEGIVGIVVGLLTFIWPGMTGLILLYLIAFWAIMTGVLEIVAAFHLRKEISTEWLLGLSGVLSLVFGILLIFAPGSGALALAWLIGFYAIMFGFTMIGLGLRLRNYTPDNTGNEPDQNIIHQERKNASDVA